MTLVDLQKKQIPNLERIWKEYRKCEKSPVYFLTKYAKIEDPSLCRTINWQPWSYLIELLDIFEENKEVIILKARQLGISWLVCGYAIWKALFYDNVRVLMLSRGEEEAWELISKCRFIFANLPAFLKRQTEHNRRDFIEFPSNNSKIKALPSTEDAGSGYTASLVIRDELDKHPYAAQNFAAVGPTIDAGGGQMIDLSTVNKERAESHFRDRYMKAKTKQVHAKHIFLGWRLRPTREEGKSLDEWFEENIRRKYPPFQIEQEYPETEEDALKPARTVMFFDKGGIDFVRRDCYPPIDTTRDGVIKIWKHPELGVKYCSFLDPSDGSDPHAAVWMDSVTAEVVCVSHGRVKAEVCAEIFDEFNRKYNNAFNEFELNANAGQKVAQVLDELHTPNRRVTGISKDRKNKYGWWTGGNINSARNKRQLMLDGLEEAIRNKRIRCHYGEFANELDAMMKKEGEAPRVPSGRHDDLTIAVAGCWQIKKEAKAPFSGKLKPGRCVGF